MPLDYFSKLILMGIMIAAPLGVETSSAQEVITCRYDRAIGDDREFLQDLKANEFKTVNDLSDDTLALLLSDCLGSPDPELRDAIAYEGLVTLLRGKRVSDDMKRTLLIKFSDILLVQNTDEQGFLKPFAALCVAEVARSDRIEPFLSSQERISLVDTGTDYLKSITDYRGFDEKEGWRHGVAHVADLLMQLTLNENIDVNEHRKILAAIATQITPHETFYIYGESGRLARPVLFIAMRNTINEQEWTAWLKDIADPQPLLNGWPEAFLTQASLAKRHNTYAFLSALYLTASSSDDDGAKETLPGTISALESLP